MRLVSARRRRLPQGLTYLRQQLTDALLPGIWSRDGVRLSGAGTVAGVDDARCSTATGRYVLPSVSGQNITCGDLMPLNGVSQFVTRTRFTIISTGVHHWFDRDGATAATQQLSIGMTSGTQVRGDMSDGTNTVAMTGTTVLAVGGTYEFTLTFDGTQSTVGARFSATLATWNDTTKTWGAANPESLTVNGIGNPTALVSISGVQGAIGGRTGTQATGLLDRLQVWLNTLSTAGTASLDYDGTDYTNKGTLGASFNGTPTNGIALASDDLRWGPPLLGGGGTANPTWDAVNRLVVCDGVTQYLRMVGALGITQDCAFGYVGTLASNSARDASLSLNAGQGLRLTSGGTANISTGTTVTPAVTTPSGLRAVFARRTGGASVTVGMQIGSGSEQTTTGADSAQAVNRFTIGASEADAPASFAAMSMAVAFLYKADFAGKQPIAYPWAQSLGATL